MPQDLVLVRHSRSEGNVAIHAAKKGDDSHIKSPGFRERHSSRQAEQAGEWVREHIGDDFDRYYTSSYVRAMETAGHLGFGAAQWYIDLRLRERERGREDLVGFAERDELDASRRERAAAPMYWRPLNGESIADVTVRIRDIIETLHRETSEKKVLIVRHGEVIESFRVVLERMTDQQYADWTNNKVPEDRIHNGQVLHFTRRDPESGSMAPYIGWWRSVSATNLSLCNHSWKAVHRPSLEEMLRLYGPEVLESYNYSSDELRYDPGWVRE